MKKPSSLLDVKIVGGLQEVSTAWAGVSLLVELYRKVDTHGQSPWHFTVQASLDLNPGALAISHIQ